MNRLESAPGILPLYLKSALPLVPAASRLPFVPGGGGEIPAGLEFELEKVTADPGRLAGYARVCGYPLRETLPPAFPHVLAFPLQMAVMSDGAFPVGAVGLVHISNRITQLRPIGRSEEMAIKVSPTPLEDHSKGMSFSLLTEITVEGETVWTETSTMLSRGRPTQPAAQEPSGESFPSLDQKTPASAVWKLPGDLGRRYGAVSGDRNPIHMHPLAAKAFGFPGAIAHGMWTKARALAQLENQLPESFTTEVRFRRPILLPAKVEFAAETDDQPILFSVRDARKKTPHLEGLIRPFNPDSDKEKTQR